LRDIVVFPHMVAPLFVGRTKSVNALSDAMGKNKRVFLATQKKAGVDSPEESDINRVGTIGKVLQLLKLPDGTVKALVEGEARAKVLQFLAEDDFFKVALDPLPVMSVDDMEAKALCRSVVENFEEYAKLNKSISKELMESVAEITEPSKLADTVAAHFLQGRGQTAAPGDGFAGGPDRAAGEPDPDGDRGRPHGPAHQGPGQGPDGKDPAQVLPERTDAGDQEGDGRRGRSQRGALDLEKKINEKKMSEEGTEKVKQELRKLKMMTPMSAEATVVRNYIDWLISLPWYEQSEINHDLDKAEVILDEDHYGLKKPKERIIEYLAVQALTKKVRGPILCLVGPRASARPRWPNRWPGPRAANTCGCRWAGCATRPKSAGTAGPISAPCRARSSSP
jgi:ATP-dependent Lon protease